MKKRVVSLLLAVVMMFALAGCGNTGNTPSNNSASDTHTFYYATYVDPILQWDPSGSVSNEVMVFNEVYETLLRIDPATDEFTPCLATSYEANEDGTVWTFKLREGVTFTDGSAFNADVVKFCLERTISLNGANAYLWNSLDYVEVIDDYTVALHLKYAAPADIICAGSYGSFMYSKEAVENDPDFFNKGQVCGSGPYTLAQYQAGDYVVLSRNENYWGGWSDNQYDSVIFKYAAESSSRRQMIESNEVSAVNMLPAEDVAALSNSANCKVVEAPTLKNMIANYNTASGPCSDVRVRQALAYALPYEQVANVACGGHATIGCGYIPAGLFGHTDALNTNVYDLEKARELLTEAGYADGMNLVLTYMSGDEMQRKTAELWATELAKLNVTLSINAMTWDGMWDKARSTTLEDRQDILVEYWMIDIASPSGWMAAYTTEAEPIMNLSYYSDPEVDALIAEAASLCATDRDAATEVYYTIQEKLAAACPATSVVDVKDVWVLSGTVDSIDLNAAYTMVARVYDARWAQ